MRGVKSEWYWDVSATYGRNTMDFNIVDTLNVSLGPSIPPNQDEFFAGTIAADQFVANADLSRQLEIGLSGPTNLAAGVEFRREGYQIQAGEEGSYIDGGVRDQFGNPAIPGAQVFAGWRPSNERDESRHNIAGYVDFEGDIVPRLRLGLAGRVENYSDFGSTADGKITARFEVHRRAVIRGAASTGFRAPSLGQSNFSATSTNFLNLGQGLVPVEVATFPVASEPARALGATDLKPEESTHLSAGLVLTPFDSVDLAADYYRIDIDDRIVLSGNFTAAAHPGPARPLRHVRQRAVLHQRHRHPDHRLGPDRRLPDRPERQGQPAFQRRVQPERDRHRGRWPRPRPSWSASRACSSTASRRAASNAGSPRTTCVWPPTGCAAGSTASCGEAATASTATRGTPRALDQDFSAQWIADLELSFHASHFTLGAGVQNLFDTYPEILRPENARAPVHPATGSRPRRHPLRHRDPVRDQRPLPLREDHLSVLTQGRASSVSLTP